MFSNRSDYSLLKKIHVSVYIMSITILRKEHVVLNKHTPYLTILVGQNKAGISFVHLDEVKIVKFQNTAKNTSFKTSLYNFKLS
jgi:frataxin-like iron-binding protein CyaY